MADTGPDNNEVDVSVNGDDPYGVEQAALSEHVESYISDEPLSRVEIEEHLEDNYRNAVVDEVPVRTEDGEVRSNPTYTTADDGTQFPIHVTYRLSNGARLMIYHSGYVSPEDKEKSLSGEDIEPDSYQVNIEVVGDNPEILADVARRLEEQHSDRLQPLNEAKEELEEETARFRIKSDLDRQQQQMDGESFIEQIHEDVSGYSWDDIVLPGDTRREIQKVIRHKQYPDVYEAWDRQPNGILLIGEEGVGKTRSGKIVASQTDSPFLYMDISKLTDAYLGVPSDRLNEVFDYAREEGAVIFFDEAEPLLEERVANPNDAGGRMQNELVNTLNVQLDGIEGMGDGLLMAATNQGEGLDDAATRDERFDYRITVKKPETAEQRADIFRIHTENRPGNFVDLDYQELGEATEDYTPAQIAGTVNRAIDEKLFSHTERLEQGEASPDDDIIVTHEDLLESIKANEEGDDIAFRSEERIGFDRT